MHPNEGGVSLKREKKKEEQVCFRARLKSFHRLIWREQLCAVITYDAAALCFAAAVKSVFQLTQTRSVVTVILSTWARGAHLRGSDTEKEMFYLVCTNGPGAAKGGGGM